MTLWAAVMFVVMSGVSKLHYYKKNIGDYRSATAHLSLLEHGVYNWLLDTYYLNEKPLPLNERELFRMSLARTEDEKNAVRDILVEFFVETENGWVHNRCESEVKAYHAKAETNRKNGGNGGRPKKQAKENPNGSQDNREETQSVNSGIPQETLTKNQEPLTKNQEPIFKREDANSEISDPRFDLSLNDVNTKLQMGGLKPITQEELQSLLVKLQSSYGHKTQMVKNQILGKAFEWIERQQRTPLQQPRAQVSKSTAQTLAEQRAAMSQNQYQGQIIDVGEPKKPLMIEEVGRA